MKLEVDAAAATKHQEVKKNVLKKRNQTSLIIVKIESYQSTL